MTEGKNSFSYKHHFKKEINIALLFLRIFVGIMMLTHAYNKIENFDVIAMTFPTPFGMNSWMALTLITITELGCSLLLILGIFTRIAALILMFGMITAAFFTFPEFVFNESELAIMYLAIYITLFITGGGDFILERYIKRLYLQKRMGVSKF